MSTSDHFLCHREDLAPGEMRPFQVGKSKVVLCRHNDDFFVLRDICSHHGAQLSGGILGGTNVASEVGEYHYGRDGLVLRCPRHGFEYDITTGRSLHDPEHQRVKAYPVVVRDDDVFVQLAN